MSVLFCFVLFFGLVFGFELVSCRMGGGSEEATAVAHAVHGVSDLGSVEVKG